jgi:hypothetical protein
MAAFVTAPGPLAASIQSSILDEAKKRGLIAEDAYVILPPTRTYTNAEIQRAFAQSGIDGVLVINVGDTGVQSHYAGTFFQANYSGSSSATGTATGFGNMSTVSLNGTSSGTMTGTSTPMYRYSRQTAFTARLVDPKTTRNFWVGNGQVSAGGLLFVGNGTSASNAIGAIFDDLQKKGLIGTGASG